jgi:hypothetical protein
MTEAVYEIFWDCEYCGAKGLLGKSHRHCPTCGAAQNPEKRYFPPPEDRVPVHEHRYVGADLRCPACEAPNSAAAAHCVNCGSPVAEGESVQRVADSAPTDPQPVPAPSRSSKTDGGSAGAPPAHRARWPWIALLAVLGLVVGWILLATLWTRPAQLEVQAQTWERKLAIEELRETQQSSWCDEMPADARGVGRSERVRSTRKVPDGEDCRDVQTDRGDGTFTVERKCTPRYRNEDVMAAWCDYRAKSWEKARELTEAGDGLSPGPAWPHFESNPCQQLGCLRAGQRTEAYSVVMQESKAGAEHRCDLPEDKWRSMTPGSIWLAKVGKVGDRLKCGSLIQAERP